jgi:hypothetical protein
MGYCNYCKRDIGKKDLIKCPDCNMLYCRKCFVEFQKLCLNCYTLSIEYKQEEMLISNDWTQITD